MPISLPIRTRRISQQEFGAIAYDLMQHVFAIHNEFGRFFNEAIYKRELAARMGGVAIEVPVTVTHGSFSAGYVLDVLVHESGLFEFKSVDAIHPRHRAQTINYLLLADLGHAKIVNVRPEKVEHEFVNCSLRLDELRTPLILENGWDNAIPGATVFKDTLNALITDWGSGLELSLYEGALSHFLIGDCDVPVHGLSGRLGVQRMRLAAPDVAFKLTALTERLEMFAIHVHRLLEHTSLKAILWVNVTHREIRFTTIQ